MHLIFISKIGYFLPVILDPHSILPLEVSAWYQGKCLGSIGMGCVDISFPFQQVMAEVLGEAAKEVIYGSEIEVTAPLDTPTLPSTGFMKGIQSTNPFDESADLDEESYVPQNYQIRTGSRRGLISHGYSTSEESLDRVSVLSVIPEESLIDVETAESCDLPLLQSHNSRSRSHDSSHVRSQDIDTRKQRGDDKVPTRQTPVREEVSTDVPWYQENSQQEIWETTPAYHHQNKGVCSEANRHRTSVQKAVVTEEVKPVLQVSQSSETPVSCRSCLFPGCHGRGCGSHDS